MSKMHQLSHQLAVRTLHVSGRNELLQSTPGGLRKNLKCGQKRKEKEEKKCRLCVVSALCLLYQRYRFVCLALFPLLPLVLSFPCSGSRRVTTAQIHSAKISKRWEEEGVHRVSPGQKKKRKGKKKKRGG